MVITGECLGGGAIQEIDRSQVSGEAVRAKGAVGEVFAPLIDSFISNSSITPHLTMLERELRYPAEIAGKPEVTCQVSGLFAGSASPRAFAAFPRP